MIKKGYVKLSPKAMEWRLKTFESRRNLWKFTAGRKNDRDRMAKLGSASMRHKEAYRAAHAKELKAEDGDNLVLGIEEAQAVLAARALPVPTRTGKEQVEEEEEEDAVFEMVARQSLQPPPTGSGTHDVEAGTSGTVRRPVTQLHSPSPVAGAAVTGATVAGAAVTGAAAESPVQATGSPVPTPGQATRRMVDAVELEDLWMEMGMLVREILRRSTGNGGLIDDPRVDQLLNEYAAQFHGDESEGQ